MKELVTFIKASREIGGADGSEFTYEDGFTARYALAESAKIAEGK